MSTNSYKHSVNKHSKSLINLGVTILKQDNIYLQSFKSSKSKEGSWLNAGDDVILYVPRKESSRQETVYYYFNNN